MSTGYGLKWSNLTLKRSGKKTPSSTRHGVWEVTDPAPCGQIGMTFSLPTTDPIPESAVERLRRLNLFTLEKRRLRGDMIQVFKYLNTFCNADHSKLFTLQPNPRTRNNGKTIQAKRCFTDIGRSYFSNRAVRHWNNLSAEVVSAETINFFKNRIDRHFSASVVHQMRREYVRRLFNPSRKSPL